MGWAGGLDTPSVGQGDPLSPLLFVIVMDAFSKMLDKAVRDGLVCLSLLWMLLVKCFKRLGGKGPCLVLGWVPRVTLCT